MLHSFQLREKAMHYYQFNVADYRKDTQHLTPIEHYIYRELMDWYYLDERPIINDSAKITRRVRLGYENVNLVEIILDEFFILTDNGWEHGRINAEIEAYKKKATTARVNGSKGGRPPKPRKTQLVPVANPEETRSKPNHEPLTNIDITNVISSDKPKRKVFKPPTSEEVAEYLEEKDCITINPSAFIDFYEARGWKLSSGTKMANWKAAVRTWISREGQNAKTGSRSDTAKDKQKLTPAQRTEAKREAIRQRESSERSSTVGALDALF